MTSLGKRKLAAYVLAIFLAGAGCGALIAWNVGRRFPVTPLPAAEIGERLRARFQSQLGLTPEQMHKIDPMIEQAVRRIETIRRETASQVFANADALDERMLAVLTPEQKAKFEKMESERRAYLHQKFGSATNAP